MLEVDVRIYKISCAYFHHDGTMAKENDRIDLRHTGKDVSLSPALIIHYLKKRYFCFVSDHRRLSVLNYATRHVWKERRMVEGENIEGERGREMLPSEVSQGNVTSSGPTLHPL